jgi:hypothetical protein
VPREVHEATDYGAMEQAHNEFESLFDFGTWQVVCLNI